MRTSARWRWGVMTAMALKAAACGTNVAPAAPEAETKVSPRAGLDPRDPPVAAQPPTREDPAPAQAPANAEAASVETDSPVDAAPCELLGDVAVTAKPAVTAVASRGTTCVVAALSGMGTDDRAREGITLVDWGASGNSAPPHRTLPPMGPGPFRLGRGAPALLAEPEQVVVAAVRTSGLLVALRLSSLDATTPEWTVLAKRADPRFPPALRRRPGGFLLAYVQQGRVMRTRVLALNEALSVEGSQDVTPPAMGATAPVFMAQAAETDPFKARLLIADAREGFSPIVAVHLNAAGEATEHEAMRTVGTLTDTPELAAIPLRGSDVGLLIAYTTLGTAAASAVGLVSTADRKAPVPLIPSRGYGRLDVVAAGRFFAASAWTDRAGAPLQEIRVLRGQPPRANAAHVIAAPSGRPSLTALPDNVYCLGYSTPNQGRVRALQCGSSAP